MPEDVANVVSFLSGPDSDYVSGASLTVSVSAALESADGRALVRCGSEVKWLLCVVEEE